MSEHNSLSVAEAAAKMCPMRAQNCIGDACMAWRWSWDESDGFEEHKEETLDWRETFFGDEADEGSLDSLQAWLTIHLGEAMAASHAGKLADVHPDEDYDAWDALCDLVDTDLNAVFEPKLEDWIIAKRPEGEHWGVARKGLVGGQMIVVYQRPASKRGGCGMAGMR